ncbi:hypothetical protein C9374_007223 [Naegleria lovaniensis]|uniref:Uncharacterized protein n=1 Tax=Naegleria lovaniensis TaxID=51637 RepID=A0AA88H736_NAELO|nr:uncharacterized protein C9374_007223 [Naegleria lovaniensis]KAG2393692.1 hypothetical protein C9374_007223 [Naegleria lovaniensis]
MMKRLWIHSPTTIPLICLHQRSMMLLAHWRQYHDRKGSSRNFHHDQGKSNQQSGRNNHEKSSSFFSNPKHMLQLGLYLVPAFALYQQFITSTQQDQKEILDELSSAMSELKQWEKRLMELEMNDHDDEASPENIPPGPGMYGLIPEDDEAASSHFRFESPKERKYASIYDELRHIILVIHAKTKQLNASIKSYGLYKMRNYSHNC